MTCTCGHVLDEHEHGAECTIERCPCVHFEEDPEADP